MSIRILSSLVLFSVMASIACNNTAEEEEGEMSEAASSNAASSARFATGSFEIDSGKGIGRLTIKTASASNLTFSIESRMPGNETFAAKIAEGKAEIEDSRDAAYPRTATFGRGATAVHFDLSRDGKTIRVRASEGPIPNVEGTPAALTGFYRSDAGTRFVNEGAGSVLRIRKEGDTTFADLSVYNLDTEDAHFVLLRQSVRGSGKSTIELEGCKIHIELTEGEAKVTREGACPGLPENADFAGTFAKY